MTEELEKAREDRRIAREHYRDVREGIASALLFAERAHKLLKNWDCSSSPVLRQDAREAFEAIEFVIQFLEATKR